MRAYRHRFRRIDRRVVAATRELIAARPWRGNPGRGGPAEREAAKGAFLEWLGLASAVYGIRTPNLAVGGTRTAGFYVPDTNLIVLPKFSVFTLLHEFRHAWQCQKGIKVGDEEDARGWSVSLVYLADPRFYWNAVRKGLVFYA